MYATRTVLSISIVVRSFDRNKKTMKGSAWQVLHWNQWNLHPLEELVW